MKTHRLCLGLFLSACLYATAAIPRAEWFRGLDLEASLAQASLVVVAQVSAVSETTIVAGGKGESSLTQYTFKPVRVLKGVFARPELILTNQDLGQNRGDGTNLERGDFRLLLLGRSSSGYMSCHHPSLAEQRLPQVRDAKDPLLDTVLVMLHAQSQHDRVKRLSLLLEPLKSAEGASAVVLLKAIERRSLLAAQFPSALPSVTRLLANNSPAIRQEAATALRLLIQNDYLDRAAFRSTALEAVAAGLARNDGDMGLRLEMLSATGEAGSHALRHEGVMKALTVQNKTYREEAERWSALGKMMAIDRANEVATALEGLPLDAPDYFQFQLGQSLARLAPARAAALIRSRAELKLLARIGAVIEIQIAGELPPAQAVPVLLELFAMPLGAQERDTFAQICQKLTKASPDARLIPTMSTLLDPARGTRWYAVQALQNINTLAAAKVMQANLRNETDLGRKLETAAFLGRHGMRDGYPYAIEHISESHVRDRAVVALAAIGEPKAVIELREILKTSNDLEWRAAAVRGLSALRDAETVKQLLVMAQDLKSPLAPQVLLALGDAGEAAALPVVRKGIVSRNQVLASAGARAAAKLLAAHKNDAVRDDLAVLLSDAEADAETRLEALEALAILKDARLDHVLPVIVREAALENGTLISRAEQLLRERKIVLKFQ